MWVSMRPILTATTAPFKRQCRSVITHTATVSVWVTTNEAIFTMTRLTSIVFRYINCLIPPPIVLRVTCPLVPVPMKAAISNFLINQVTFDTVFSWNTFIILWLSFNMNRRKNCCERQKYIEMHCVAIVG